MDLKLLELLQCPHDGQFPLKLSGSATASGRVAGASTEAWSGELRCLSCGRSYPIREGIVCILPDPLRQEQAHEITPLRQVDSEVWRNKRSEMQGRDEQAVSYDRFVGEYLHQLQSHHILKSMDSAAGRRLLDIGSGTGRLTLQFCERVREIVALDFSFESLKVLRNRMGSKGGSLLHLVQADASLLPFRDQSFDGVTSAHVMHHVPLKARHAAFSEARRVLEPGCRFIMTAYHYDLYRRLRMRLGMWYADIEKEGYHGGRIYYHCFTRPELARELSEFFEIETLKGIINVPREVFSRLESCGSFGRVTIKGASLVDRFLSRTALASSLGLLLLAIGRRR